MDITKYVDLSTPEKLFDFLKKVEKNGDWIEDIGGLEARIKNGPTLWEYIVQGEITKHEVPMSHREIATLIRSKMAESGRIRATLWVDGIDLFSYDIHA